MKLFAIVMLSYLTFAMAKVKIKLLLHFFLIPWLPTVRMVEVNATFTADLKQLYAEECTRQ